MADTSLLERTLRETVPLNKARGNFVAKFLVALLQVKTVNLSEIANVFAGRATSDSHYKRIQRFLRFFELPSAVIALALIRLLPLEAPFVLTLDRTNWQLGPHAVESAGLGHRLQRRGNSHPVDGVAEDGQLQHG